MYAMEYYSTLRKEILPFVTTYMELEGIMLSKISQSKTKLYNTTYTWNPKKPNSQKQRVEWWLPGAGVWGKWGNVGQRVQTSSQKINKFWESNAQHCDYN